MSADASRYDGRIQKNNDRSNNYKQQKLKVGVGNVTDLGETDFGHGRHGQRLAG
jgi:hypothetical protein